SWHVPSRGIGQADYRLICVTLVTVTQWPDGIVRDIRIQTQGVNLRIDIARSRRYVPCEYRYLRRDGIAPVPHADRCGASVVTVRIRREECRGASRRNTGVRAIFNLQVVDPFDERHDCKATSAELRPLECWNSVTVFVVVGNEVDVSPVLTPLGRRGAVLLMQR